MPIPRSIPREGTKDRIKFDLLTRRQGATRDDLNEATGHNAWSYINDTKRLAARVGGIPRWSGGGGSRRFWIDLNVSADQPSPERPRLPRRSGLTHTTGSNEHMPAHVIFLLAGPHPSSTGTPEGLPEIVQRKMKEGRRAGSIWWGYGGKLLHPERVHEFVQEAGPGAKISVLMSETKSKFQDGGNTARKYSTDNYRWRRIPAAHNVTGSKFALVLETLEQCDFDIDLAGYSVFRRMHEHERINAANYIRRADKACLTAGCTVKALQANVRRVTLQGVLKPPYALYLSNV